MGVQHNSQGHILHGQAAHRLTAQVRPRDHFQRLHAFCHQRTGTAQRSQIHRAVAHHSCLDGGIPLALADHDLVAKIQQPGAHSVHAPAGGRPCRADDFARTFRGGAYIIDGAAFKGKRQGLALVQCFHHPLVCLIPGGVHHTGKQHGIPRFQRGKILRGARGSQSVFHRSPLLTAPRWRGGSHGRKRSQPLADPPHGWASAQWQGRDRWSCRQSPAGRCPVH